MIDTRTPNKYECMRRAISWLANVQPADTCLTALSKSFKMLLLLSVPNNLHFISGSLKSNFYETVNDLSFLEFSSRIAKATFLLAFDVNVRPFLDN